MCLYLCLQCALPLLVDPFEEAPDITLWKEGLADQREGRILRNGTLRRGVAVLLHHLPDDSQPRGQRLGCPSELRCGCALVLHRSHARTSNYAHYEHHTLHIP